jgi:uncharacterized membrane protein YwzB
MRQTLVLLFCAASLFVITNQSNMSTFCAHAHNQTSPISDQAPPKEKADIAYKILVDSYNKYLDDVFKTAGLFHLTLGWIFTSDKARQFLQENKRVRKAVLVIVIIMAIVHASSLYGDYLETNKQLNLLNEINYMPSAYFERYRITNGKLVGSLLISVLGFGAMFISIYSLGDKSKDSAAA